MSESETTDGDDDLAGPSNRPLRPAYGRGAEITYEFEDMEVDVPSRPARTPNTLTGGSTAR